MLSLYGQRKRGSCRLPPFFLLFLSLFRMCAILLVLRAFLSSPTPQKSRVFDGECSVLMHFLPHTQKKQKRKQREIVLYLTVIIALRIWSVMDRLYDVVSVNESPSLLKYLDTAGSCLDGAANTLLLFFNNKTLRLVYSSPFSHPPSKNKKTKQTKIKRRHPQFKMVQEMANNDQYTIPILRKRTSLFSK